jgi:hypothetical protein
MVNSFLMEPRRHRGGLSKVLRSKRGEGAASSTYCLNSLS